MIIHVDRKTKIELLNAMKVGYFDTEKIPTLDEIVAERQPARVLTIKEMKELWQELEKGY